MNNFFSQLSHYLYHEYLLHLRKKESLISTLFFASLVILVLQFSFQISRNNSTLYALPFVWLATLFGGVLHMNRTFEMENEAGIFDMLRLSEGAIFPFFVNKLITNFIFIFFLELFSFGLFIILFNLPEVGTVAKSISSPLLLGGLGFVLVGTTFSGMLQSHQQKDLLLPIILYPVLIPLIIGVLKSVEYSTQNQIIGLNLPWIQLLIAFDLVFLAISLMVVKTIVDL